MRGRLSGKEMLMPKRLRESGDLVIWHSALHTGSSPNSGDLPSNRAVHTHVAGTEG